jgi:hypothetical protein
MLTGTIQLGYLNMLTIFQEDKGYDKARHQGKDIIDYVEKSVRRKPQTEGAVQKAAGKNQKDLPKRQS